MPLALERAREVLVQNVPYLVGEDSVKVARTILGAADFVMRHQIKVDEARLRRQEADILPALLEAMRAEKAKLAPILEARRIETSDAAA